MRKSLTGRTSRMLRSLSASPATCGPRRVTTTRLTARLTATTTSSSPRSGAKSRPSSRPILQERRQAMRISGAFMLFALPILLLVAFGSDVANSGHEGLIIRAALAANPVGSCTSAGTDNAVYGLTGYKFPSTSMTFKTNQSTFPTYMSKSEVQSAIKSAFTAWDGATKRALFVDGGTTTAKANTKDGVNTVAFGNLGGGYVAAAYGWFNTSKIGRAACG